MKHIEKQTPKPKNEIEDILDILVMICCWLFGFGGLVICMMNL